MARLTLIECSGDDLQGARSAAVERLPPGSTVVLETVRAEGGEQTLRASGKTAEEAVSAAVSQIPEGVQASSTSVLVQPGCRTITIRAFDEDSARLKAADETGDGESLDEIRLVEGGSRGLLGLGRKPGQYEASISQEALVEVSYPSQARIQCWVGDPAVKPVAEAMKAWYRSQAGSRRGTCDDCNRDLTSQAFLRPGGYLCCEPCTNVGLGQYVDWDEAFQNIDRALGPGVPASVKDLIPRSG